MGDTHATGIGYGIIFENNELLEEALEEAIDIEFLLADEYPLLVDHGAGNAWSGSTTQMILIDSTVYHDYSFLIEVDAISTDIPHTGLNQLKEFCDRFGFPFTPGWKIFSYLG